MRYRQKPNGIWVVDYEDDQGVRRRRSTGIKSASSKTPPAEAKAAAREIVLGIRAPSKFVALGDRQARKSDGRMTMPELFDKAQASVWHPDNVRSQRTIWSNVRILSQLLDGVAVEDMTFTRLEKLVADMKERGYKPATIKRKLAMVNTALRMATMWTGDDGAPLLAYKPPMPKVEVKNLKDRIIGSEEEAALFAAVEKRRQVEPNRQWFRFRVLLRLLFDTGGRLGETITLGPGHIADRGGNHYLTFQHDPEKGHNTKSGKSRTIPLTAASVEALGSLMDQLVRDPATGEWRFFGFSGNTAWKFFRDAREDVIQETGMDLSEVTLHTIRHTTLTRLARGGMELLRLQTWAGHSDPKITQERYVRLVPSDLDAGLAILGAGGGTSGMMEHANRIKHGNVPNTLSGAKGANPGTPTLQ